MELIKELWAFYLKVIQHMGFWVFVAATNGTAFVFTVVIDWNWFALVNLFATLYSSTMVYYMVKESREV